MDFFKYNSGEIQSNSMMPLVGKNRKGTKSLKE